jgi:protein-L-isoaspartate(D-aspartate) O-methyltransferase
MSRIDRKWFAEEFSCEDVYKDAPLSIPLSGGSTTILTSPHMHAVALSQLAPVLRTGARAVDLGCGLGYIAGCMQLLTEKPVLAVDASLAVIESAKSKFAGDARMKLVEFAHGDLDTLHNRSFDAISLGFCLGSVDPRIVQSLSVGGRALIPIGEPGTEQVLTLVEKTSESAFSYKEVMSCLFSLDGDVAEKKSLPNVDDVRQQLAEHQMKIKAWRQDYSSKMGRNPSLTDMRKDSVISSTLDEIRGLTEKLERIKSKLKSSSSKP